MSDGLGRVQFGALENHPVQFGAPLPQEKASPGCNMSGTSWRMQAMHDSLVRTSFDNAKWCDSLNRKDLLDQVSLHFETRTSHNVSMFHHTWSIHKWKDKFWQSKEFSFWMKYIQTKLGCPSWTGRICELRCHYLCKRKLKFRILTRYLFLEILLIVQISWEI